MADSLQSAISSRKVLPFSEEEILSLCESYLTPFYLYDKKGIKKTCQSLTDAFKWSNKFTNYFAVKACPNPHILSILKDEGFGADCSSLAELYLADSVGYSGEEIMFTSNETLALDFKKAKELGAIINFDDISHIDFYEEINGELPSIVSFRYNPGAERVGNAIIGNPKEAKFGLTKQQLMDAYEICKRKGVHRFGLHTMIVSNSLDMDELVETAKMCFNIAVDLKNKLNINLEFINLGGGIGVPYRPEEKAVDFHVLGNKIKNVYEDLIKKNNLKDIKICYENGRCITGPNAVLITRVVHQKNIYKNYLGVDACMSNLMRPGLYNAYHHITLIKSSTLCPNLPKTRNIFKNFKYGTQDNSKKDGVYDVVGSLCENNDKFAIDRYLGEVNIGDILVIHDVGAHGHAMGFNYNGKLRSAEYLKNCDGKVCMIRRKEELSDYFKTLMWCGLPGKTIFDCSFIKCSAFFSLGILLSLTVLLLKNKKY